MVKRDQKALVQLKVRMREPLRARLEEEASLRGLSINAEIVDRVEYTFQRSDLLSEVLSLAFGERLAGLLIMVGLAMAGALEAASGYQDRPSLRGDDWTSDPTAYEAAVNAAKIILDSGRPRGRATTFDNDVPFEVVEVIVAGLSAKKHRVVKPEHVLGRGPHADAILRLVGDMAARMAETLPKMPEAQRGRRKEPGR
jgi:hypothetical protein